MAQGYFKPVQGGVLLDVSCGSGLFSRRFAQSGDYESVIALDYSENMLRQSNEFIKQDVSLRNKCAMNPLPFRVVSSSSIWKR